MVHGDMPVHRLSTAIASASTTSPNLLSVPTPVHASLPPRPVGVHKNSSQKRKHTAEEGNEASKKEKSTRAPVISRSRVWSMPPGIGGASDHPPPCPFWLSEIEQSSLAGAATKTARYFMPPPWLLPHINAEIAQECYHNWTRIRSFVFKRISDGGKIAPADMSIDEWRQALRGNYSATGDIATDIGAERISRVNELLPPRETLRNDEHRDQQSTRKEASKGKKKVRAVKSAARSEFFFVGKLLSYDRSFVTTWRGKEVCLIIILILSHTHIYLQYHFADFLDLELRKAILWEIAKMGCRLDIWSLDHAYLLRQGPVTQAVRQGRYDALTSMFTNTKDNWLILIDAGQLDIWDKDISHHIVGRLLNFMGVWPNFPKDLARHISVWRVSRLECVDVLKSLLRYYIRAFIAEFDRLPTMPFTVPQLLRTGSTSK